MSFRDNLQHLRSARDMSQAELAQQLGVSRQSVAKWEAEKSYPEMDKLIKLCDLFECSLDDLVRGDLAACEQDAVENATEQVAADEEVATPEEVAAPEEFEAPVEALASRSDGKAEAVLLAEPAAKSAPVDAWGYDAHMRRLARRAAIAAAVLVGSVGIDLFVTGGHARGSLPASVAVYLLGAVIALRLFVPVYLEHEEFRRAHPRIADFYTPEQKSEAHRCRVFAMIQGAELAVIGLGAPVFFWGLFPRSLVGIFVLFLCFAGATGLVVYAVMMDRRVDVTIHNEASADTEELPAYLKRVTEVADVCKRLKNAVLVELRR